MAYEFDVVVVPVGAGAWVAEIETHKTHQLS